MTTPPPAPFRKTQASPPSPPSSPAISCSLVGLSRGDFAHIWGVGSVWGHPVDMPGGAPSISQVEARDALVLPSRVPQPQMSVLLLNEGPAVHLLCLPPPQAVPHPPPPHTAQASVLEPHPLCAAPPLSALLQQRCVLLQWHRLRAGFLDPTPSSPWLGDGPDVT